MNVKIHNFSVRLCVLSQTMVQQKYVVAFLHSWLYILGSFDLGYDELGISDKRPMRYHGKFQYVV